MKYSYKVVFFIMLSSSIFATDPPEVNDVHSQMNLTRVESVLKPKTVGEIQTIVRNAKKDNKFISIAGARHAMGGQQFGENTLLLDMSDMKRIIRFDPDRGIIEVEAGIQWPELVQYLLQVQKDKWPQWGIIQKQTGADRLSIGGALSANAHGRGLKFKPFIDNVESFTLVDAEGTLRTCNRKENSELFDLAIGGYGLFGVIIAVELRLMPRTKLERVVEVLELKDLMKAFEKRISEGFLFGDFQYDIDTNAPAFMKRGVFSCYKPVDSKTPMPPEQKEMSAENWDTLYYLAHTDKSKAWDVYSQYYLSTNGQLYWSDIHQMSIYGDNYHLVLDEKMKAPVRGSEMITEIDVKREHLADFMSEVAKKFKEEKTDVIYGTVRLIEKDDECFLTWAKDRYACVIFNLHVNQNPEGLEKAKKDFRFLIDMAIKYEGTYFLTYHRFATREQVEACYPQFPEFLRLKKKYDPQERFQSEWYRHYKKMFSDKI